MSDQTSHAQTPASAPSETARARRETVVLSEVPDATDLSSPPAQTAVPDDQLGSVPGSNRGSNPGANANSGHNSGALAVLSQRYRILAEVGHGDLCVAYKAHDKETDNTVALKLLRSDVSFDPASLERFKNDVLLAGGIVHPAICRVYDVHASSERHRLRVHAFRGR